MSQENVKIVRRLQDAMNRRDWSTILELFDPNIEVDLSRNVFNPGIYRGHSGLERWAAVVEDVWEDFQGVFEELIETGDKVVTATSLRGKGRKSGVEVEMRLFSIWTLRDSRVVRLAGGYRDRSEALEAVGLSEQDAHADSP